MDIFEELLRALEVEERVMLATIVSTSGSTPASTHARMLVRRTGAVGTVGGGCMEGEVLLHAHRLSESASGEIVTFHLDEDNVEHGLICGGTLEVLIEPVTRSDVPLIASLLAHRRAGRDTVLARRFPVGGGAIEKFLVGPAGVEPRAPFEGLDAAAIAAVAIRRQTTQRASVNGNDYLFEPVAGQPQLVLFGGGHVSKAIARIASLAGFGLTVVDDRPAFSNEERFPEAGATIVAEFAKAFDRLAIAPSSYLVIVTRGHRHDEEVLEQAIRTPAAYIGMIGSQRKIAAAFEHIVERGGSREALRRVHTPVGIEIGALTAEEIAVSIVAELIRVRRGAALPLRHKSEALGDPAAGFLKPSSS